MAKPVGLRTEILVTLTLLLGAALLFGGIMMLHLMEKNLLEERAGQLRSLAQVLATSVIDDDTVGSDEVLLKEKMSLLEHLPENIHCNGWWIYDRNLTAIDSYSVGSVQPFSAAKLQMVKLSQKFQEKMVYSPLLNFFDSVVPSFHLVLPIGSKGHFGGLLEVNFSFSDIREKTLGLLKVLILYIVLYGIVLILTGYYLIHKNIIRPARNLLTATEAVSQGNLETRLPSAGPVEIAQLATAYNQMVDALRKSHGEKEQHIASLEETNHKLQQARDELIRSEKMASVGQLSAGLAHELGNPLAALIGYLELLKQTIESFDSRDIVDRSLVETNRIDFLVRELLDFSRPAENSQREPVDMARALNSAVQLLKNQGAMSSVEIINALPEFLPSIQIDRNKLQQVFINLLLNAVQACSRNGEISLSSGDDAGTVWVGIRDNGCGIPAVDLGRIFDPFYTTKPPGEGTGLGLAMCQRIVEEAGGVIEVDSELGKGSFFRIVFEK